MTLFEAYSFLFADTLLESLILPLHAAYVHKVMFLFGGYNTWLIWLFSTLGTTLGFCLNWIFGRMARSLKKPGEIPESWQKAQTFLQRYGVWILPLALFSSPIGGLLTVASGVLEIRFTRHTLILLIATAAWYGVMVYAFTGA